MEYRRLDSQAKETKDARSVDAIGHLKQSWYPLEEPYRAYLSTWPISVTVMLLIILINAVQSEEGLHTIPLSDYRYRHGR